MFQVNDFAKWVDGLKKKQKIILLVVGVLVVIGASQVLLG